MSFGRVLYNLRTARGLTQMELSKALDGKIAQSTIGLYESGRREPRKEYVEMLAQFFNVPVAAFYMDDSNMEDVFEQSMIETIRTNPKFKILFRKTSRMSEQDIDAVLTVVNAISKERDGE